MSSASGDIQICEDLIHFSQFSEIILSVSGNRHFPWKVLGIPIHLIVNYPGIFNLDTHTRLTRWTINRNKNRGNLTTPGIRIAQDARQIADRIKADL